MKKLDAVLFDLDGTLIDTAPDFIRLLNALRAKHNLDALPNDVIRQQVSNGAKALVELGFNLSEEDEGFEALRQQYLDMYYEGLAVDTCVFPGLDKLLDELDLYKIPWGIVTNKPSRYTEPLLERLGLAERCGTTVCPDHVTNRKPHPEPIFKACNALSVSPDNTLYVGDHLRDIESGNNAGNTTVAVSWGYIAENQSPHDWNADHVIDTANDLIKLVHGLRSQTSAEQSQ